MLLRFSLPLQTMAVQATIILIPIIASPFSKTQTIISEQTIMETSKKMTKIIPKTRSTRRKPTPLPTPIRLDCSDSDGTSSVRDSETGMKCNHRARALETWLRPRARK
eukprot:TRINITY_DN1094_c0_g1::TRINITY_DN1094_c0_g1_i1::g.29893::m.29893 TRINITY_DN1094_c0_g1::TRINITY_DN1094_c0_g1_i1::g.29893  ORF type:complete len:108 (-),score=-19.80,GD_AH_C/PF04295.8/0.06 TRINITY_DN1094_c0_g1_i1:1468-1791(-)